MKRTALSFTFAAMELVHLAHADGVRAEIQLDAAISPNGSSESTEPHVASAGSRVFAVWQEIGPSSDDV